MAACYVKLFRDDVVVQATGFNLQRPEDFERAVRQAVKLALNKNIDLLDADLRIFIGAKHDDALSEPVSAATVRPA